MTTGPLFSVGLLVQVADRETLEAPIGAGPGIALEPYQLDLAGRQRRISAVAIQRGEVVYRLTDERGTWPERGLFAVEAAPAPLGPATSIVEASGQIWKLTIILPFVAIGVAASLTHGTTSLILWAIAIAGGLVTSFVPWVIVRCPRCGDRWLWRTASTGFTASLRPALGHSACPACGLTAVEMQAARHARP